MEGQAGEPHAQVSWLKRLPMSERLSSLLTSTISSPYSLHLLFSNQVSRRSSLSGVQSVQEIQDEQFLGLEPWKRTSENNIQDKKD